MNTERKSCFDCVYCKKIYADMPPYRTFGFYIGGGKTLAAIECTRNGSWPLIWADHQCNFHKPKEKYEKDTNEKSREIL